MIVMPSSGLTYDRKRIYVLLQTHDPDGTCFFGPPVKQKPVLETEQRGDCTVIRPEQFRRTYDPSAG
jgi:hypothetical protein